MLAFPQPGLGSDATPVMKPFTPGLAYKKGKLYRFKDGGAEVIRAWPPTAWRASWTPSQGRSPWTPCRPEISITRMSYEARRDVIPTDPPDPACIFGGSDSVSLAPGTPMMRTPMLPFPDPERARLERRARLFRAFLAEIPVEARTAIRRLPSRHFHALSVLCRCPGPAARDLAEHNPALFFALCSIWVFHSRPPRWAMRSIRALLPKRQALICEALGFPGTPSAARVLRRVVPGCMGARHGISRLLTLRDGLRRGNPLLGHLPRINAGVIRLLDPVLATHVTPRLLLDVAALRRNDCVPHDAFVLLDTVRMMGLLEDRRPAVFRSMDHLRSEHAALIDLLNLRNLRASGILDRPLPPPPIEGNDEVRPCRTPESIIALGRDGRNCVASYIPDVASGERYIYRVVTGGKPATLELRPDRMGVWYIRQFQGFQNEQPTPEARGAVARWMANARSDRARFGNP